jgi:hypothetical protein
LAHLLLLPCFPSQPARMPIGSSRTSPADTHFPRGQAPAPSSTAWRCHLCQPMRTSPAVRPLSCRAHPKPSTAFTNFQFNAKVLHVYLQRQLSRSGLSIFQRSDGPAQVYEGRSSLQLAWLSWPCGSTAAAKSPCFSRSRWSWGPWESSARPAPVPASISDSQHSFKLCTGPEILGKVKLCVYMLPFFRCQMQFIVFLKENKTLMFTIFLAYSLILSIVCFAKSSLIVFLSSLTRLHFFTPPPALVPSAP